MNNVKALNGIGPGAGKGARERATERAGRLQRERIAALIKAENNVAAMFTAARRNTGGRPLQYR